MMIASFLVYYSADGRALAGLLFIFDQSFE